MMGHHAQVDIFIQGISVLGTLNIFRFFPGGRELNMTIWGIKKAWL